jgi:hypothetical protein
MSSAKLSESSDDEDESKADAKYKAWKQMRHDLTVPYDIERWYAALGPELTFPTAFVEVLSTEAKALGTVYGERCLGRRSASAAENERVGELRDRIQEAMDSLGGGFFVRLSSRSPKDAAMPTREAFEREVIRRTEADGGSYDVMDAAINGSMRAFFEVGLQSLQVLDASAAIKLFTHSERVHRDLHDADTAGALEGMKVAISQYNPYCYYPDQVAARDAICAKLENYWQSQVKDVLSRLYSDYVIDIAILADGACRVIELNPFEPQTGGGLFGKLTATNTKPSLTHLSTHLSTHTPSHPPSLWLCASVWEDEADRSILEGRASADPAAGQAGEGNGETPTVVLRLMTAPRPRMQATLEVFIAELPHERDRERGGSP